jgi:hypothetical protein
MPWPLALSPVLSFPYLAFPIKILPTPRFPERDLWSVLHNTSTEEMSQHFPLYTKVQFYPKELTWADITVYIHNVLFFSFHYIDISLYMTLHNCSYITIMCTVKIFFVTFDVGSTCFPEVLANIRWEIILSLSLYAFFIFSSCKWSVILLQWIWSLQNAYTETMLMKSGGGK